MSGARISRARGPQTPKHAQRRGDVGDLDRAVVREVAADPLAVVVAERRAGHDREALLREAGDGEVALDPTAAVEHLRVGDLADVRVRPGCRRGARRTRPSPGPEISSFANDDLVEDRRALAGREVLGADRGRPVLPAQPRGRSDSSPARGVRLVPVDPLPARLLAERGAVLAVPRVRRRDAQRPARLALVVRVADVVVASRTSRGSGRACRRASGTGRRSGGRPCARGRATARPRRSTPPSPCRSRPRPRGRGRRSRRRRTGPAPRSRRGRTRCRG